MSLSQMSDELGMPRSTLLGHLDRLCEAGYITRRKTKRGAVLKLSKNRKWGFKKAEEGVRKPEQGVRESEQEVFENSNEVFENSDKVFENSNANKVTERTTTERTTTDITTPPPPEKRGGCPKQLKDDLAETWRKAEGDRDGPDWTRADWVQLERLWKRRPEVDEILRRWRHYLADDTHFAAGHSLKLFCSHFDKWKDPPGGGGRRRKKLDPSRTAGTVYKPN